MTREEAVEAVKIALAEVLERELPDADADTRLFEDLHLDSTSILELLMALEDAVDIQVDPEELRLEDFKTIGSVADYVLAQTSSPVES